MDPTWVFSVIYPLLDLEHDLLSIASIACLVSPHHVSPLSSRWGFKMKEETEDELGRARYDGQGQVTLSLWGEAMKLYRVSRIYLASPRKMRRHLNQAFECDL